MEALPKRAKEADVAARVVQPLLTAPEYLGIPHANVRNQDYLKPQAIDKAAGRTSGYYPDFSIWFEALPLVIVEVKAPAVAVEVGYREAGQYALHLNRQYRSDIDPCQYIIATNGSRLLAGYWNATPEIDVELGRLTVGSTEMELLRQRASMPVLQQRAVELRQRASQVTAYTATPGSLSETLMASKAPPNRFASALIPILTRYFASPEDDEDPAVYDNGYISTGDQSVYDNILESLLKERAHSFRNPLARDVETGVGSNLLSGEFQRYAKESRNSSKLLLVVGHVGSGKSLFIRRFKELLAPPELKRQTHWSFINFNNDYQSSGDAYRWACESYITSFQKENPEIDLFGESSLTRIFSVELNGHRGVYSRLEAIDAIEAERQRASDLKAWLANPETFSKGITRHHGGQAGGVCVAVFDNVDKFGQEEQLSIFSLALRFTSDHRTMTILQLRDETFERYKDSKPLDTFKTGTYFHIKPPRFSSIVRRRLELALVDFEQNAPKDWAYTLENGARIVTSRENALDFLRQVYSYIFDKDPNSARLLQGIAGRNVRRGLDIFFRVLTSGHLTGEQITSISAGAGSFPITSDLVLRTIMRGDDRYFTGKSAYVVNILDFDPQWISADNLLVPEVLFFLASRLRTRGTIGIESFFSPSAIAESLQLFGYTPDVVHQSCAWLLARGLVEADNLYTDELSPGASIRLSSSGFMHIRVLTERLEYLAACLYRMPYLSKEMAESAAAMFLDSQSTAGLSSVRKAQGVQNLRKYIRALSRRREEVAPNLTGQSSVVAYLLAHIEIAISEGIRPLKAVSVEADALDG